MLFNSNEFLLFFFPLVLVVFYYLKRRPIIKIEHFLLAASFLFYSFYSTFDFLILSLSIVFNFITGNLMNRSAKYAKMFLSVGIIGNLSLLCYFKYAVFFISILSDLSLIKESVFLDPVSLPLGISFFTLTQIAFLIDLYYKREKMSSWSLYALFVVYFPHLLAGPIVYHKNLVGEFVENLRRSINWDMVNRGMFLLSIGLFKKICIADRFSYYVKVGFEGSNLSGFELWFVALSYAVQIYYDFSGYSDMARGISLMMDIDLPINFASPYAATSLQDFWRRWHMSLGEFLKKYIYIPLGGSKARPIRNTLAIFFISGLWHGASWNFILWGVLHGIGVCLNRALKNIHLYLARPLATFGGWFLTFTFVCIGWVLFRAPTLESAVSFLYGMFGGSSFINTAAFSVTSMQAFLPALLKNLLPDGSLFAIPKLLVALTFAIFFKNSNQMVDDFTPTIQTLFMTLVCFISALLLMTTYSEFLYFNF